MSWIAKTVLKSESRSPLFAFGTCGVLVWAVRPLAASAPLADFEAIEDCAEASAASSLHAARFSGFRLSLLVFGGSQHSEAEQRLSRLAGSYERRSLPLGRKFGLPQASRIRARQRPQGRASTRCFAARAGEVRLLAGNAIQRKMQFQAVPWAPPNPSIERTSPGKPGAASHIER